MRTTIALDDDLVAEAQSFTQGNRVKDCRDKGLQC